MKTVILAEGLGSRISEKTSVRLRLTIGSGTRLVGGQYLYIGIVRALSMVAVLNEGATMASGYQGCL